MDDERLKAYLALAKNLAGVSFAEMLESRESSIALLGSPEMHVRQAAVLVCESYWEGVSTHKLADTCLSVMDSTGAEHVVTVAVDTLARLRSGTRDANATHQLARLVMNPRGSDQLQLYAYFALREVWFGKDDPDLLKGIVSSAKLALREHPGLLSEDRIRKALVPEPGFPKEYWDNATSIDWDFVSKCLAADTKQANS